MTAVKKTAFLLLVIALVAGGCKARSGHASKTQTETMAPAAPTTTQPESTDPMTQTVDVEDSRSIAEGDDTSSQQAPDTTTAKAVRGKTGAAATSRKLPSSQSRPAGRTQ